MIDMPVVCNDFLNDRWSIDWFWWRWEWLWGWLTRWLRYGTRRALLAPDDDLFFLEISRR
jgi:hypothetical protein